MYNLYNKFFLMFVLLFSFITTAAFSAYSVDDFLNNIEKKQLLDEFDSICGDTWCEGDFNYEFNAIDCNQSDGTCLLSFVYIKQLFEENETSNALKYSKKCLMEGFFQKEDLIQYKDLKSWPLKITYTEKIYDAVSDCIDTYIDEAYTQFAKKK